MNNAFKIQFTLIQIWDIFSFIKRRALILAVLNFKCLFFMTFFRYIFHDFWVVAAHIYMDICTALFSQLTIALYVLLKEHFSITESLASLFFFFFFWVQVFYCPRHTFKEIVQHQWTQWNNHYNWTSGPRDCFLAQHNCYSHRNQWVRNLRNTVLYILQTVIILWICLILNEECMLPSHYTTIACYMKEHY